MTRVGPCPGSPLSTNGIQIMVHETVHQSFTAEPSVAAPILEALATVIEDGTEPPTYLGVPLMEDAKVPGWLQKRAADAADEERTISVRLTIHPNDDSAPAELREAGATLREAYQEWHTNTIILENFSSDELEYRAELHLSESGVPIGVTLGASFDIWGLPESAVPAFDEAATLSVPGLQVGEEIPDEHVAARKSTVQGEA